MATFGRLVSTRLRLRWAGPVAGLAMLFSCAFAMGSDLVIEVRMNPEVTPGSSGDTLEIDLANTSSTNSYTLSAFSVGVDVGYPITVSSVNEMTAATYVFAGNSSGLTLSGLSPFYTISDQASISNPTLAPDTTWGLGLLSFSVAPGASPGPVAVTIDPSSQLTGSAGRGGFGGGHGGSLSYTWQSGTIIVVSSVPEPSSVVAGGTAVAILAGAIWVRRRRRDARRLISLGVPC